MRLGWRSLRSSCLSGRTTARGLRMDTTFGSGGYVKAWHQASLDEQLGARPDHSQWAIGHSELAVWSGPGRLDLELAADLADVRLELERD